MPGPNSAPNGDAGLVRGYPNEEFVWVERHNGHSTEHWLVSKREVVKRTGKTDASR